VNFTGTFLAARAALPVFREQQSGHVIIISSIVGKRGVPYMGGYAPPSSRRRGWRNRCAPNCAARASI
jgi:NAD(P)-dependent dehydrogenase (short-subunit alcohol dehydrogenase family)